MTDQWQDIAKRLRTEAPDRVLMLKGAIVIEALAEELLAYEAAKPVPASGGVEAKTWIERFRSGEPLLLHYHSKRLPVDRILPHRKGHISVEAKGTGLPVVMREDGTYSGDAPIWLEAAALASSTPAEAEPVSSPAAMETSTSGEGVTGLMAQMQYRQAVEIVNRMTDGEVAEIMSKMVTQITEQAKEIVGLRAALATPPATAPDAGVHGPFGYLVIDPELDEEHWRLSDDPDHDPELRSIALFTKEDPFALAISPEAKE